MFSLDDAEQPTTLNQGAIQIYSQLRTYQYTAKPSLLPWNMVRSCIAAGQSKRTVRSEGTSFQTTSVVNH